MKLISIPKDKYEDYKLDLIFDCYKWDPQFSDSNTVAKHAIVLTKKEHQEIKKLTEQLDQETRNSEEFLNRNLKLTKTLNFPKRIKNKLELMNNYDPHQHIRLMRYDFHPTNQGWALSEVNSDVPGGFAEGSLMPKLANNLLNNKYDYIDFSSYLVNAITKKTRKNGTIALVHCTSYADDRQVMQFLGDLLTTKGYKIIYMAADHIEFKETKAYSILDNNEGQIDCIIRFNPIEWIKDMKHPNIWQGYFNTTTTSCNHPIAIYTQTKRFPMVWDILEENNIKVDTWKKLLPETKEIKKFKVDKDYIFKPVYGRVGEKISIKEACIDDEYQKILNDVKKHKRDYLIQKKFISTPLISDNQEYHVCLGSYTVDGEHAGYYARVSTLPRIDSNAKDIPVLIERD